MSAYNSTHYHVYIAGDWHQAGPPRAFLVRGPGYRWKTTANRIASRIEPDPALRLVKACKREDCKVS